MLCAYVGAHALGAGAGCADDPAAWTDADWELPAGFPRPRVPADNPMNPAKVELGRRLFYDQRLSGNQTQACASCHQQARAFTEARPTSLGSTGQAHFRNAMSLTNVAYNVRQTWANPVVADLEAQALLPMFGEAPVELGLAGLEDALLARLAAVPDYVTRFREAFPEAHGAMTLATITKAIAAFERTLISADSAYDRFWYGRDFTALSKDARDGLELFFSERLECFHCHGDFNFTSGAVTATTVTEEFSFHNTALYNRDGQGAYPPIDTGLMRQSGDPADMGKFRPPTLRNIALTAPYMHDGSIATLDEVLDHYAAGGRTLTDGPNAGVGSTSPLRSPFVRGFTLSSDERRQLLAFLDALTDTRLVTDPRFADPFAQEATP